MFDIIDEAQKLGLLIEPQGIEIRFNLFDSKKPRKLLIEPQGIEMTYQVGDGEILNVAFNRTTRN